MAQLFRAWLVVWLVTLCPPLAHAAPSTHDAQNGLPDITLAKLPAEARETLRAIKRVPGQKFFVQGGPFTYERDGVVFKNYEQKLPKKLRGYYHEYTVKTSGTRSRGARRIVCGPLPECYYSADHYQTFYRIRE